MTSAGRAAPAGTSASSTIAHTSRLVLSECMLRRRKATCASRYSAAPPNSAAAGTNFKGSSTPISVRLMPTAISDDAGDHGQVHVGVGVARDLVAFASFPRALEASAGDDRDDVEVRPPQRCRDDHSQHRCHDDARTDGGARADADGDDRLAEGDDHDRAVALSEMSGHELPAVDAKQERPAEVEHQR